MQLASQEGDAEETDEQNQCAARHLVDTSSDHQKTDVHEGCAADVADGRQRQQEDSVTRQNAISLALGSCASVAGAFCLLVVVSVVGVHGPVSILAGSLVAKVFAVERHEADHDPAARFADKHLRGL